ncbi:hypothetical protein OF83DRAFT_464975 [Amylostereum chailletii]|nr:hypothetical protein OF83DRAFT_464975 [Amylostereum chailletii]
MDIGSIVSVDTIRSSDDVRSALQTFGSIRRVEHNVNQFGNVQRFLVEFYSPDAAAKACRCSLREFDVRAFYSPPADLGAFHTGPSNMAQAHIPTLDSLCPAKYPGHSASTDKIDKAQQTLLQLKALIRHSELQNSLPTPPASASYPAAISAPSFTFPPAQDHTPWPRIMDTEHAVSSTSNAPPAADSPMLSISPDVPQDPQSSISLGLPPIQTNLDLTLCGVKASCDLSKLKDFKEGPSFIISILVASKSDRDKWVIVASFYRRASMVDSAIVVLNKMVDVMKKCGMSDHDLRPAFLMLSSCYTELGRKSRVPGGSETEASRAYMEQSRQCLQKVYGCNKPEPAQNGKTLGPGSTVSTYNRSKPSRFEGDRTHDRSASGSDKAAMLPQDHYMAQDRQAAHDSEQSRERAAKRALEENYAQERALRRKLERHVGELEQKLARAEERENRAREQVHAEVAKRRRAEQRAEDEEARRQEAEKNGVKPFLGELAGVLQRAAGGDASALASLVNGFSHGSSHERNRSAPH